MRKLQPAKCGVYVLSGQELLLCSSYFYLRTVLSFYRGRIRSKQTCKLRIAVNEHTYHLYKGSINWSNGRSTTKKEINVYDLYTYHIVAKKYPIEAATIG